MPNLATNITHALAFIGNAIKNKNVSMHCYITHGSQASIVTCHCRYLIDGHGGGWWQCGGFSSQDVGGA
jgi:hypothetical protein